MKKKLLILCGLMAVLCTGIVLLGGWIFQPGVLPPQPIAFNHKLHLERAQGINCPDCHQFVTSQTYAGLPSKQICFGCHNPEADKSETDADAFKPKFAILMAFAKTAEDIPWQRVTATREDVFFSHRRHVSVAKIECRQCHPYIPDSTQPLTRGPMRMEMNTCIGCHKRRKVSVDCVVCHR